MDSSESISGLLKHSQIWDLMTAVVRLLPDPAVPHGLHMYYPDPGSKRLLIRKAKNIYESWADPDRSQHMIGMAKRVSWSREGSLGGKPNPTLDGTVSVFHWSKEGRAGWESKPIQ